MFIINKNLENIKILKEYTAGMVLKGWEVKSLKIFKNIEIKYSFILIIKNEIFLKKIFIYDKNKKYNNKRVIKLLLKKNEIKNIKIELKNFKIFLYYIFLLKNIIKAKIVICANND